MMRLGHWEDHSESLMIRRRGRTVVLLLSGWSFSPPGKGLLDLKSHSIILALIYPSWIQLMGKGTRGDWKRTGAGACRALNPCVLSGIWPERSERQRHQQWQVWGNSESCTAVWPNAKTVDLLDHLGWSLSSNPPASEKFRTSDFTSFCLNVFVCKLERTVLFTIWDIVRIVS